VCVYTITHHHLQNVKSCTSRHQDRQDVLTTAHLISCGCRCSSRSSNTSSRRHSV